MATFVIAAAWPGWDGGFVWGPRLLIPGLIPAFASLAPWLSDGGYLRRRVMIGLLAVGSIVNLPGVLISTRAQLELPVSPHGPTPVRQYELVAPAFRFTAGHLFEQHRSERYLDFWQVLVARAAGRTGLVFAGLLSALLLGICVWGSMRSRSVWIRMGQEPQDLAQRGE